ncbi:hypothetical protein ANANG_G00266580 [Anguilla anguilla]|uniref:Uncharacterized protein n=1 Tax=Anguilla anguilla TaxID=7936 RepID=A0A9D3RLM5_ANGAN|nr:hypothetical protein ANANG_G00266580 [Anguilla anguilla]
MREFGCFGKPRDSDQLPKTGKTMGRKQKVKKEKGTSFLRSTGQAADLLGTTRLGTLVTGSGWNSGAVDSTVTSQQEGCA